MIMARSDNGIIGHDGQLPWHLPADLKHFKSITQNSPMIMGRKTFDSLPGLLPRRRHIVLTRDQSWSAKGAEQVTSIEEALNIADAQKIFIIGGAEIYKLFLDIADTIIMTEVHITAQGDTFIDDFDKISWREVKREYHDADNDYPAHSFVTLERKSK